MSDVPYLISCNQPLTCVFQGPSKINQRLSFLFRTHKIFPVCRAKKWHMCAKLQMTKTHRGDRPRPRCTAVHWSVRLGNGGTPSQTLLLSIQVKAGPRNKGTHSHTPFPRHVLPGCRYNPSSQNPQYWLRWWAHCVILDPAVFQAWKRGNPFTGPQAKAGPRNKSTHLP